MHQVSRSWKCLWLFSWRQYQSFHHLSPLGPPKWAWRGACWQALSCIPNCAAWLSWAWVVCSRAPKWSLSLHRPDMRLSAPLEWEGFSWIEKLDEKTPKLAYPNMKPHQNWLCMLFMQNYWLFALSSPSEITGMHCGDKLEAVWKFVGQDPASQGGVSGTASSAPVSGCLQNTQWGHRVQQQPQGDTHLFETGCSPCHAPPSNRKQCQLPRRPASLSEPSSYSPGESPFLMYTAFSWLGVFVWLKHLLCVIYFCPGFVEHCTSGLAPSGLT